MLVLTAKTAQTADFGNSFSRRYIGINCVEFVHVRYGYAPATLLQKLYQCLENDL